LPTLKSIGRIGASAHHIALCVREAAVAIKHEDRDNIAVRANYPESWKIRGGYIYQTSVQVPFGQGGIAIGGGRYASCCVMGFGCPALGNTGEPRVSIFNGEVRVGGKQVAGSPPAKDTEAINPDRLEIFVPNAYRGGMHLTNFGNRQVDIDHWEGGTFTLTLCGGGDLKVGELKNMDAVTLHSSCTGDIRIESLNTSLFDALLTGAGSLEVDELNARTFSLRQYGTGDVIIDTGLVKSGTVITGR
jgi:hypothetical protein